MKSLKLILSDKTYFAPAMVFASINILVGTWVLYLPTIKSGLGLNDAQLGTALFFQASGLLIAVPLVPFLSQKLGVGRCTQLGILALCIAFNFLIPASNHFVLCVTLFLVGFCSGFTDVAMNGLVSTIEQTDGKSFMATSHGFFSLGGFIGAGLGSILILLLAEPWQHMLLVSSIIFSINFTLSGNYISVVEQKQSSSTRKRKIKTIQPLIGLALVSFIMLLSEGAVEHWSNIYFVDIVAVAQSSAGFGFVAFSLAMTLGRFYGDELSQRIGSIRLLCLGFIIAFIAYFPVISASFYSSILGFGLLGLGLSVIIPELFRLAGNTKEIPPSLSISIVSGIGYVGFLTGPILLGFLSNHYNLKVSFSFLAGMVILAFLLVIIPLRKNYS